MMMLIRKGRGVHFVMEDDARVSAPRGTSMLHDPKGTKWGKCSLLFAGFTPGEREPTDAEAEGEPRYYLGKQHKMMVGRVELPPRALSSWEKIGRVKQIFYTRLGSKAPGYYKHPFGVRTALMLWRKGKMPVLYKRGSCMRLELGADCLLDDRGIVFP
jgi:hypothetical protein